MRYRTLGSTGIQVSEIGFGVWTLTTGWWGKRTDEDAIQLLRQGLDHGITFFDTADAYGEDGRGERVLAKALEGHFDEVVIATKFGYDIYSPHERVGQQERPHDWSAAFAQKALDHSLQRLGVECIDVYQLHNPRADAIASDELFAFLDEQIVKGKIRSYGAALGPAIGWVDEGVSALRDRKVHMLQMIHNVFEQDPGRELIAAAEETGAGLTVRVPHSSGLLEGHYTLETTFAPEDHRSYRPRIWLEEGLKKLETLDFLTRDRDQTIGQAALKFVLASRPVASVLPNIYDAEQLVEFCAASDKPDLTAEDLERIAELYVDNFGVTRPVAAEA